MIRARQRIARSGASRTLAGSCGDLTIGCQILFRAGTADGGLAYYHVRQMARAAGFAVPPIRILAPMMGLVGFAGCYNPPVLQEGAPCQRSEQCPEPQQCVLGSCSLREAPADAGPLPDAMAMIDAAVDAMPVPCVADGLTCRGNTAPLAFPCGTHCWVKCTEIVPRATAETRCAGWTGVPGEIESAAEDSCVNQHIATAAFWIGAVQGDGAATLADKWTWNGDATRRFDYTNWATGKPDDADGVESGQEQCATIRPGGTWDDDSCIQPLAFFCTRPLFR